MGSTFGGSYTHNLFSLSDKTREKKMENSLFYLTEQSGREILQGMEENASEMLKPKIWKSKTLKKRMILYPFKGWAVIPFEFQHHGKCLETVRMRVAKQ